MVTNTRTDKQTDTQTSDLQKKSFSAPLGPIPTLCPNFMEISSLVSEKNGNKQTYIQTNKQKRENKGIYRSAFGIPPSAYERGAVQ